MAIDLEQDSDEQDQAETFDETNLTEDGEDIARPDMMRNVYDVTSAEDDADDDEFADEDPDDFDPDAVDETELESLLEEDDGIDEDEGPSTRDQGDLVAEDDESPSDYQTEAQSTGPDDEEDEEDESVVSGHEARLDTELGETFPASDPLPANPGSD